MSFNRRKGPKGPKHKKKSHPARSKLKEMRARGDPRLKPGQPDLTSKLNDELREQFCGLIGNGASDQAACGICGLGVATLADWKVKGVVEPDSAYGAFVRAYTRAKCTREVVHVNKIITATDWKSSRWLLCNWAPETYKMVLHTEHSGPDGLPIPVDVTVNPFEVRIVTAPAPADEAFQIETHTNGELVSR